MPGIISTPLLALAVLLVFASAGHSRREMVAAPQEKRVQAIPEGIRLQREETLRLRRELVGRRILREVRAQLPKAKLPEIMTQFNIRPDERLRDMLDEEIFRMLERTEREVRGIPAYDFPNAEMMDICEEVPGLEPDAAPVLSCVVDGAIIEASRSVAAIVHEDFIAWDEDGERWILKTEPLSKADTGSVALCETEPIRNSPSARVVGTGFLVEESVVATAGHVVYDEGFLQSHLFVFGYVMKRDGEPKTVFDEDDVYRGAEIMARETGDADFALIRLDRLATDRQPLDYRKNGKVPDGTKVYMLGHPEGMPQKYVGDTPISWNGLCSCFLAPLDSRPSNSGSPVFNAVTHQVEGIMVRDAPTYETICGCVITAVHSEAYGYAGADVVRTTRFAGLLVHPNEVLVRSHQLPAGTCAVVEVGNSLFVFDSSEAKREQFLPYDALGFYLRIDTDCTDRYQPGGGSVWDIVATESGDRQMMVEACFR